MGNNTPKAIAGKETCVKGVYYDENGKIIESVYDRIRRGADETRRLEDRKLLDDVSTMNIKNGWYEDTYCMCFVPRERNALIHLLVVPHKKIKTIHDLEEKDIYILKHMHDVGKKMLLARMNHEDFWKHAKARDEFPMKFCFHVPPHNSIDHLHLHCFVLPMKNIIGSMKYFTRGNGEKEYDKRWGKDHWTKYTRSFDDVYYELRKKYCKSDDGLLEEDRPPPPPSKEDNFDNMENAETIRRLMED